MAKNVTELPVGTPTANSILYYTEGGTDYQTTVAGITTSLTDRGIMYDAAADVTYSPTPTTLTFQTAAQTNAKGFTLDEALGTITFNSTAVGKAYKVDVTFVAPRGFANNTEAQVQLNLNYNGTPELMDIVYVANTSSQTHITLSGENLVFANADGDVITLSLVSDGTAAGAVTPVSSEVFIEVL